MSAAYSQIPSDREACIEPHLISIPAAWFLMGSASGQDCERPVHRVWVDAFQLATTQVTNAEYEQFLRSTGSQPPPFCT
ncbi:MAG: SUMF1/EgtB/PvdO family nonheme iron enzyme, partial [Candidatus Sulfotelmatobacter sp.]